MTSAPDDETVQPMEAVPHAGYAAFIAQLRLERIWLARATIDNRAGPQTPEQARIRISDRPSWEPIDGGFRGISHYRLQVTTSTRKVMALVEATYAVDFASELPMTDEFFLLFGKYNLPLNTWPFLREFVATAFARMNWDSFTLPALIRGAGATDGDRHRSNGQARPAPLAPAKTMRHRARRQPTTS
jgi:hypothetical protein